MIHLQTQYNNTNYRYFLNCIVIYFCSTILWSTRCISFILALTVFLCPKIFSMMRFSSSGTILSTASSKSFSSPFSSIRYTFASHIIITSLSNSSHFARLFPSDAAKVRIYPHLLFLYCTDSMAAIFFLQNFLLWLLP